VCDGAQILRNMPEKRKTDDNKWRIVHLSKFFRYNLILVSGFLQDIVGTKDKCCFWTLKLILRMFTCDSN
jgi:hypothetical protein